MAHTLLFTILFLFAACSKEMISFNVGSSNSIALKSELRITAENGNFPATSLGAESAPQFFRVSNTGDYDADSISISLAGDFKFSGGVFPGENGNCTASLAKGSSCLIELIFVPSTLGNIQEPMNLAYKSHGLNSQKETTLMGVSSQRLSLRWTTDAITSFPQTLVDKNSNITVRVRNESIDQATSLNWQALHTDVAIQSTTCTSTLPSLGECEFVLRFSPEAKYEQNFKFELSYLNGASEEEKLVRYFGLSSINQGQLVVNALTEVDFGDRFPSEGKAYQYIEIENSGDTNISNLVSRLVPPFELETSIINPCPATIEAGMSCNLLVSYTPTTEGDQLQTTLVDYVSSGETSSLLLPIRARTLADGDLLLSRPQLNFSGKVISFTRVMTITITNSGDRDISALSFSNPTTYHFATNGTTCTSTLAARSSCEVSFSFTPGVDGDLSDSATVHYTLNGVTANKVIPLSGKGYAANSTGQTQFAFFNTEEAAELASSLPTTALPYRSLGNTTLNGGVSYTLYLKNVGNFLGRINSLSPDFGNSMYGGTISYVGGSFPGTGGDCLIATFMAPGETCSVVINTFAGSGAHSLNGQFVTDAWPTFQPIVDFWSGGVTANRKDYFSTINHTYALKFSENNFSLGTLDLEVDTAISKDLILTNISKTPVTGFSITSTPTNGFSIQSNTCLATINPGQSCSIRIAFSESTPGPYNSNLVLNFTSKAVTSSVTYPLDASVINDQTRGTTTFGFFPSEQSAIDATVPPSTTAPYRILGNTTFYGGVTHTIYLKNTGDYVGKINSIVPDFGNSVYGGTYQYAGGTFPGTGGTCAVQVFMDPDEICSLVVNLVAGSSAHSIIGQLIVDPWPIYQPSVTFWSGGSTQTRKDFFSTTNHTYALKFPETNFAVGVLDLEIDTFIERELVLTNIANSAITNLTITSAPQNGFAIDSNTCTSTLNPGQSCILNMTFTESIPGSFSSTLGLSFTFKTITSNVTYNLSASAIDDQTRGTTSFAFFHIEQDAIDALALPSTGTPYRHLGNTILNGSIPHTLYLKNVGDYQGKIISIDPNFGNSAYGGTFTYAGGSFPGTGGTCSLTNFLAPDEICTLIVNLVSGSAAHSVIGQLITDAWPIYQPSVSFWSGGTTQNRKDYFSTRNYTFALGALSNFQDFGVVDLDVATHNDRIVTFTNISKTTITSLNTTFPPNSYSFVDGAFPGTGGSCVLPIVPGGTCSLSIRFAPVFIGAHNFNLTINFTDSAPRTMNYPLQGSAVSDGNI